ncbi:DUF1836 domain-containing protein [Planococcus sp. APC 3906]|uniref:DUF1836 domain-containing protein n=1 Tax=Planococcus sp. APC 3906 TaxID=3035194 RepID=UPI0025B2B819|nr:DUF1836 domain-containing protein [Planococcus sp. APC 3906]MDN3448978.1 DUF1836 domain-containing protein [Planococcus sp. APC 3906]
MKENGEWLNSLALEKQVSAGDIPKIELYIDQVIELFEEIFADAKRNSEEKILTKTMINNYAKGKLFYPIQNKKYSRNHIMLISLIYQMKSVLSISDVKKVLDGVNEKAMQHEWDLESFYASFLELQQSNVEIFKGIFHKQSEEAERQAEGLEDADELKEVLLIASLVHTSNLYRRAAEKMVDELAERRKGK